MSAAYENFSIARAARIPLFVCIAFSAPHAAVAQIVFDGDSYRAGNDPLRDDRLVTVEDKPLPAEESAAWHLGAFTLSPELAAGTEYVTNLLAVPDGDGDFLITVKPSFQLNLTSGDSVFGMFAEATRRTHFHRSLEDNEEYQAGFRFEKPLADRFMLDVRAGTGEFAEQRDNSFTARSSLRPVRFSRSFGRISLKKTGGRLIAGLGLTANRLTYQNAVDRSDNAIILRESQRSRTEVRPSLQTEYAYSPDTKIFSTLAYVAKDYFRDDPTDNINRDSHGFVVSGGLHFKPARLIKVSAALGYVQQYHRAPLRDISGFSAALDLKWLPTRLTNVNMSISRELTDGGRENPNDAFLNRAEISVHHELRRNVLLSVATGRERLVFTGSDRTDRRSYWTAKAEYRPNRSLVLAGNWRWLDQTSAGSLNARDFSQMRFSLSATWAV